MSEADADARRSDSSPDPMKPSPGDIVSARYRWMEDGSENVGRKIRPCLVVKVSPDSSSVILAPISSKVDWKARDCVEIPPEERGRAGLTDDSRSWIKLTEINRVDLPNLAILPCRTPEGQIAWRRGRVDDALLQQVQSEISHRVNDKSLKGVRIRSDVDGPVRLSHVRRLDPEASRETTTSSRADPDDLPRLLPGDPRKAEAREAMIARLAKSSADRATSRPALRRPVARDDSR